MLLFNTVIVTRIFAQGMEMEKRNYIFHISLSHQYLVRGEHAVQQTNAIWFGKAWAEHSKGCWVTQKYTPNHLEVRMYSGPMAAIDVGVTDIDNELKLVELTPEHGTDLVRAISGVVHETYSKYLRQDGTNRPSLDTKGFESDLSSNGISVTRYWAYSF